MADPIFGLTERDIKTLKEMVEWFLRNKARLEAHLAQHENKEAGVAAINEAAKRGFRGE